MRYTNNAYFDDEGKQLKPFPKEWMDVKSRFKPGQIIICKDLTHQGESRTHPTKGLNVESKITEIHDGYGSFPPYMTNDDIWLGQHCGWLVVEVPWVVYHKTIDQKLVPQCLVALDASDEGESWSLKIT